MTHHRSPSPSRGRTVLRALVLGTLITGPVFGQEQPARVPSGPPASQPTTQPGEGGAKEGELVPTTHTLTVAGKTYTYTARPDFITLKDDEGKPTAKFFHTSYTLDGTDAPKGTRPITFVFNGGPGSSSVWLHLGAVGPRKVVVGDDALPPAPPGRVVENPDSWLPATDLVFIDPIGTGLSRAEPGTDAGRFYSVEGDVSSVGEFIRLYLSRHERWGSPKYLAGESYGTTRAAALSNHLSRALGIDLSGIVLISSVLEFSTIRGDEGNDLPYVLFTPSFAAVAHHHKRLPAAMQQRPLLDVVKDAEAFAADELSPALARGASLPEADRKKVAARMAELTGLPEAYIAGNNLRVAPDRFMKKLLESERKIVGRFDGTITGFDTDAGASSPEFDPSYTMYQGTYTSAMNGYLGAVLKYNTDTRYNILAGLPWQYPQGRYVNVAGQLADAMTTNPHLRVLVVSGYQDLATPYFATEYTLRRLNIPPEARQRLTSVRLEGGHMMYHYPASLKALGDAARGFVGQAP